MDALSRRLHQVLHHWATAPLLLLVLAATSIELDRFAQWDESVFMTQSAGRDGAEVPAVDLGPTREIGSVWKIGALTSLTASYPNLRLLHIMLSILVIAMAAVAINHATRLPVAVVGLVVGSYWVTFVYLGQLLRFALVAFVLVTALALSARMFDQERLEPRRVVLIAALFVVGLALGPFETGMILLCATLYWVVARPIWRNPRPFLLFTACIGGGSAVILLLDTIPRYGSVAARLRAVADLTGPTSTSTFDWALLDDYTHVVLQGPVSIARWAPEGRLPQIAYMVGAALMFVGVVEIVRWLATKLSRRRSDHFTGLCAVSFFVLMLFLAGFYSHQADRYFILPGSLLLLLGLNGLRALGRRALDTLPATPQRQLAQQLAVTLGLVVFVVPNVAAASRLDANWADNGETAAAVFEVVRALADGQPCVGIARYNTPSVQWATGCRVSAAGSLEDAFDRAAQQDDVFTFVYWQINEVPPEVQQAVTSGGWTPLLQGGPDEGLSEQVWFRS